MSAKERAERIVKWFQGEGHPWYDELVEPIEAAIATARRQALEEACKAVCHWCELEMPVSQPGSTGSYWHPTPGTPAYCQAAPIRALLDKEPMP